MTYRLVLFGALMAACSDGAGTLSTDLGSYEPVGSAGVTGATLPASGGALGTQNSNGASAGRSTLPSSSSGGSGVAAAGTHGGSGFAGAIGAVGVGGSVATGGSLGSGGASAGAGAAHGGGTSVGGTGFAFAGGSGRGTASGGAASGRGGAGAKLTGGMPGAAGSTGTVTATFSAVASIIQQHCGASGCHGGGRSPRLTNSSTLYTTLTSTTVMECGGDPLVTPSDPTNSALLKLPNWECTDFVMPQGCVDMPCLSATELATITAWIQAGAPSK